MATEAEQAWAAGIFEGEGTIVIFGPTKRQRSLSVSMTDEDVIRRFAAVVGVALLSEYVASRKYRNALAWPKRQKFE